MSCDTPSATSNCTTPANCAECGCADTGATPVLPKCQDVSLTQGTFTNATVVVNAAGCITSVQSGTPEVYTPDECCAASSGAATGTDRRGPQGESGFAATIQVDPVISTNTGSSWTVQNIGTTSAAVFQFTAPPQITGGSSTSGSTGTVSGLKVTAGLVKDLPLSLVTSVSFNAVGAKAALIAPSVTPNTTTGAVALELNLDQLYNSLKTEYTLLELTVEELRNDFEAYKATHP